MCGILAVLGCADEAKGSSKRSRVLELSRRLKHRGPDWSGLRQVGDCYLSHQRLAIIDPASGDQPLYNEDQSVVVAVNGEIYNHLDLRSRLAGAGHSFRTGSDCEVIAHLVCHVLGGSFDVMSVDRSPLTSTAPTSLPLFRFIPLLAQHRRLFFSHRLRIAMHV